MLAECRPLISPAIQGSVETRVEAASIMSRMPAYDIRARLGWQQLIDCKLLEWLHNPGILEDDGVTVPTSTILRLAIDWAEKCRDEGLPAPDSIVPDADGGIVFERHANGDSEVFYIWENGTLEYQRYHDTQLIERNSV